MLDDLRRSTTDDFEEEDVNTDDDDEMGDDYIGGELFLGMTAVERMILSMMLFIVVSILGVALLVATNRVAF